MSWIISITSKHIKIALCFAVHDNFLAQGMKYEIMKLWDEAELAKMLKIIDNATRDKILGHGRMNQEISRNVSEPF